jgi:aryl-alcohol dehydrogenase-like predicted oxidoreductase
MIDPPYDRMPCRLERTAERGLLARLAAEGRGCIVFSPRAQGLLTDRYLRDIAPDSRAAKSHGALASAPLGASRVEQVEDVVRALDRLALSPEELRAVDGVLDPTSEHHQETR